jgi:ketosteroid isomerase-like protein
VTGEGRARPSWRAATALVAAALATTALAACGTTRLVTHAADVGAWPPVEGVVAAERAFARAAKERGTHAAFVHWLADDAVLFQPGPVPARTALAAPPPGPQGTLAWSPELAAAARAGDLAMTLGPYRVAGPDAAGHAEHGTYVSVWRRRAPGAPWRVVADLGVGGATGVPREPDPAASVEVPIAAPHRGRSGAHAARAAVLRVDSALGRAYGSDGPDGLRARSDGASRLVRVGGAPLVGVAEVARYAAAVGDRLDAVPIDGAASASGDLAYTYGRYTLAPAGADGRGSAGHYLRVWRRVDGEWRLLVDAARPAPPARP